MADIPDIPDDADACVAFDGHDCYVEFRHPVDVGIVAHAALSMLGVRLRQCDAPDFDQTKLHVTLETGLESLGLTDARFDLVRAIGKWLRRNPRGATISGGRSIQVAVFVKDQGYPWYDPRALVPFNDASDPIEVALQP